ncbi:hypothetical protein SteCoe_37084 [Stentor coeruleus]|uniref:Uncharacterized protein n=1 Tax=Stentor coeruleus TaxID=5963 RepID=A0A1R2ANS5_9CILI|nr:hypothetical protein SteCoe_37084 [Stentor coeruleus]
MHFFYSPTGYSEPYISEIIVLENEIKESCTPSKLQKIMNLYKIVIEKYSSLDDEKAFDYQNRMRSLLSLPHVRNTIESSNPSVKRQKSIQFPQSLSTERSVEKTIEWHNSETKLATEIAQQDLNVQSESLNRKIIKRKRKSRGMDLFEQEVEKIVEKYTVEREKMKESGCEDKEKIKELELYKKFEITKVRKQFLYM